MRFARHQRSAHTAESFDGVFPIFYVAFFIPMWNFWWRTPHPEYDVYDDAVADRRPTKPLPGLRYTWKSVTYRGVGNCMTEFPMSHSVMKLPWMRGSWASSRVGDCLHEE